MSDPSSPSTDPQPLTPEEWYRNVYQGDDARQLTVRSIVTGMLIGGVMSISNLYIGLKTGWGLGVTVTACIIAYSVFRALEAIVPYFRRTPFTVLENYTMSSAASAAGYMASAGLVSAIPALFLTTGRTLMWWEMMSWISAVSLLGVFMAIPLRRQLIEIDQLPFPSGIATAETLKSMHTAGRDALDKARALGLSGLVGIVVAFWRDGWGDFVGFFGSMVGKNTQAALLNLVLPSTFPLAPGALFQNLAKKYTIGFEGSLVMVAAGAMMGLRVATSLLIGAIFFYGLLAPELMSRGYISEAGGYRGITSWTLWPATALMVTSGIVSFLLRWQTIVRSFSSLGALLGGGASGETPRHENIEIPTSWFVGGTAISGLACVLLGQQLFGIPWYMGAVAVLLTFFLSLVAARATGETDITPVGAMGKITQLVYGVWAGPDKGLNLMTASITAGAASHSADLLTDLKSGYLLGGNPRKQVISQLFGVLAGTLFCVPAYALIVKPGTLGTDQFPAPAAKVWQSVAEMMGGGLDKLPKGVPTAILIGAIAGVLLTLLDELLPKKFRVFVPSPTGLGLAGVIPAFNAISMFLGAFIAWLLSKTAPAQNEKYTISVASGLIAGESLMAIAIVMTPQLFELIGKMLNLV